MQNEGRVKQAVKEAMSERDISEIKNQLEALKLQITDGFKGIHARQDTTNGKVLKARDDIRDLQEASKDVTEKTSLIIKIIYSVASVIGLAVLGAILSLVIIK